jgi:hypothetical protein
MKEHVPTISQPGQRAVQKLLADYNGKTIAGIVVGDGPKRDPEHHQSEMLIIRFTDEAELRIMIGSNINTLGSEESGYHLRHAGELSARFYVV